MPDVVQLSWDETPTLDALAGALADVGALEGVRRVEVELVSPAPRALRTVLHQHGFRLEGVARQARASASGFDDMLRYARLADDPTEPRALFTAVMNSVTPRKRLIAHALISDAAGRVLLCQTSFKTDYELPGGIVEPFESPLTGLVRELDEEVGRPLPIGRILVTDWLPTFHGWDDALELIFDGGVLDAIAVAALHPDGGEIVALHWLEPQAAASTMTEVAGRHLLAALGARASGQSVYLEAGLPVTS